MSLGIGGMRAILDERGWPRAVITEGPMSMDRGRLALHVPFEFAEPITAPKGKQGNEWAHLAAARSDLIRGGDTSLNGSARFGTDPPDFFLGDVRVELAQYTNGTRRSALAMFTGVRQAVVASPNDRFGHLRSRLVMLGFDDPKGLPPRKYDKDTINDVLLKLDQLAPAPDPGSFETAVDRDGFSLQLHNSPLGEGAIAVFPIPSMPGTELARSRGFEIAASITISTWSRDIEAELKRIVKDHDEVENDVLVISAGAPDRTGLCLIADEVAVEEHILRRIALPQPDHLKRILLHRWTFGDVYELYPSYRLISSARVQDRGGPFTVPTTAIGDDLWNDGCPCGGPASFASCHGRSS